MAGQGAPALVVGFAIHGLAVARALAREGVQVHALSDGNAGRLPTTRTRHARVRLQAGLNTAQLLPVLLEFAERHGSGRRFVLFPTSDRIASQIARGWDQLEPHYQLSWAHCRELVLSLQRKDALAEFCERAGVRYPRTRNIAGPQDLAAVAGALSFPLVVKPAKPLSKFKALLTADARELAACVREYQSELPFVAQEWVDASQPSLSTCTVYLEHGRTVCMTTNRKLDALPPGLGQGTVFETTDDAEIAHITGQFLAQFDLSGPVAVEYKRDRNGIPWLIEPNVGRTEYCVDLAIQGGLNLPYVEYLHVTGGDPARAAAAPRQGRVWFDTDRDPGCFLRWAGTLFRGGSYRKPVFPFWGHGDLRPWLASTCSQAVAPLRGIGRRILKLWGRAAPA